MSTGDVSNAYVYAQEFLNDLQQVQALLGGRAKAGDEYTEAGKGRM